MVACAGFDGVRVDATDRLRYGSAMPRVNAQRRRALQILGSAGWLLAAGSSAARSPVSAEMEAQQAHGRGACGRLGPGSGLLAGRGWVASMLPGRHEFRVRGGGEVFLTAARFPSAMDFEPGRLYFISVEGARPEALLEWRILGSDWAPVSKYFLYPPSSA